MQFPAALDNVLFRGLWKLATLPFHIFFVKFLPETLKYTYSRKATLHWASTGTLVWLALFLMGMDYPSLVPSNDFELQLGVGKLLFMSIGLIAFIIGFAGNKRPVTFFFMCCCFIPAIPYDFFTLNGDIPQLYALTSLGGAFMQVMCIGLLFTAIMNLLDNEMAMQKYVKNPIFNPWNIEPKQKKEPTQNIMPTQKWKPQPAPIVNLAKYHHGKKLSRPKITGRLTPELQMLLKK